MSAVLNLSVCMGESVCACVCGEGSDLQAKMRGVKRNKGTKLNSFNMFLYQVLET